MQIELPIIIATHIENRTYDTSHIVEAFAGPDQEVDSDLQTSTQIELSNGQTRYVALSYADYRQRGFDAQYIYTYNEATIPT